MQLLLLQFRKKKCIWIFQLALGLVPRTQLGFYMRCRRQAISMGKHLLMKAPVVRSISGMWLFLTPEIKIATEAWISLRLWTDHKPGITLPLHMWGARHVWVQLEGDSTGSAMIAKVHKHLQREVEGRVFWEEREQNEALFFFLSFQFTFQHAPNTFEPIPEPCCF